MSDASVAVAATPPSSEPSTSSGKGIIPTSTYLSLPRESETWIIHNLLPTSGSMLMYGDPKIGKSYAALQLACAIADPAVPDWLGFAVRTHGPVAYIQLDTPRSLWAARIEELAASGVSFSSILQADRETLDTWPFDICDPRHRNLLRSLLAALEPAPVAVVIDTIREAHSGEENDSTAMRNALAGLVAATQPAALVIISHARKPAPPAPDGSQPHKDLMADNRGSSYVVGRMDAITRFTKRNMVYTGRAIEEGTVKLSRQENGFWSQDMAELDAHIRSVLRDATLTSIRERAKKLSDLTGKGEEACRSLIRRHSKLPDGEPKVMKKVPAV